ncbi:MAG: AraC family transcriptional regulator [Bermanella sp.]
MSLNSTQTTIGSWAVSIARALDSYQLDGKALACEFQIDLGKASSPEYRVDVYDMGRFYQAAREQSGDSAFALRVAEKTSPATFHALGFAALASDNLGQMIAHVQRYAAVLSEGAGITLEKRAEQYWLTLLVPPERTPGSHLAVEAVMAAMFYFVKHYLHLKEVSLSVVHLKTARPNDENKFLQFFNCPVVFGSDCDAFVFNEEGLNKKLPMANEDVADASIEVVEKYLALLSHSPLMTDLQKQILVILPNDPTQEEVAKKMCMSVRTLQRRLLQQEIDYRQVVDQVKFSLAKTFLEEEIKPIDQIAHLVGFADQSSFTRAFKRWSNVTPGQFRKSRR